MNALHLSDRDTLLKGHRMELPCDDETIEYLLTTSPPTVYEALVQADVDRRVLCQPRVGVGSWQEMRRLLRSLEQDGAADVLSLTIDSYTRLGRFTAAADMAASNPRQLNGYPLIHHGWRRTRQLQESIGVPLQVRHGSPDARVLFEVSFASGITAFEGGGICYNIPYAKSVAISESLEHWEYVDRRCGELAERDIIIDRELFGSLTGVLMPPCISLTMCMLEACLAAKNGVKCVSIAYPQGGNAIQDIAALRCIRKLAEAYLPSRMRLFAVLHGYMGQFPPQREKADALILMGAVTARLGGASKIVTKTYDEALGVPDLSANVNGVRLSRLAAADELGFVNVDEEQVAVESDLILRETHELLSPLLSDPDLKASITRAFADGRLDVPFSTSRSARSAVLPMRDGSGGIRISEFGGLPFSRMIREEHRSRLRSRAGSGDWLRDILADIHFFNRGGERDAR